MNRDKLQGFTWLLAGSAAVSLAIGTGWAAQDGAGGGQARAIHGAAKEKAGARVEVAKERRDTAKAKVGGSIETAKEHRGAAKEKAGARIEAAKERHDAVKEKTAARIEAAKEHREAAKEKLSDAASARTDARQENQGKRIQHGIAKGYLTTDEVTKLNTQQKAIAALESSLKSDGKVTRDEFQQLRTELNEASHCIWAEKHDTDGNQMPTYRLGKNVFARDNLTSRLADENLSAAEAKALLKDFHRTVELKRLLATGDLSNAERDTLQAEYNTLVNRYFEVR
jgi:hypothetical protein